MRRIANAAPFPVLIRKDDIQVRVTELAGQLDRAYAGRPVTVVGILYGAEMVMVDLVRKMKHPDLIMDWMSVSTHTFGAKSSGVIRNLMGPTCSIRGRDVLIVHDIVASELRVNWLTQYLRSIGAASAETFCLLKKRAPFAVDPPVRYIGFEIPAHPNVIGYGMNDGLGLRHLPDIRVVDNDQLATCAWRIQSHTRGGR